MKKRKKLRGAGKGIIIGTGALTGAFAAFNSVLLYQVMNRKGKMLGKMGEKKFPIDVDENGDLKVFDTRTSWTKEAPHEEIVLENRGLSLKGYYYPSEEPSEIFVFCSHGYRSTGRGEFSGLSEFYHSLGYNVFLVDHQAAGESEGKNISFGYHEKEDCIKWLEYIIERFGSDISIILHGISMGSATVMMMSDDERLPENVKLIVADCGYSDLSKQFSNVIHEYKVPAYPFIKTTNAMNKLVYKFDYTKIKPIEHVKNAKVPILFIHGKDDCFIDPNMAFELYNACTSEKDILIVDGADHAQSYDTNPELYSEKVREFINIHLNENSANSQEETDNGTES